MWFWWAREKIKRKRGTLGRNGGGRNGGEHEAGLVEKIKRKHGTLGRNGGGGNGGENKEEAWHTRQERRKDAQTGVTTGCSDAQQLGYITPCFSTFWCVRCAYMLLWKCARQWLCDCTHMHNTYTHTHTDTHAHARTHTHTGCVKGTWFECVWNQACAGETVSCSPERGPGDGGG
jgi:hypothetical protein